MPKYLRRTKLLTKDKIQNNYMLLKLGCMLIVAFLVAGIFTDTTTQAATGLKIYNYTTKKTSTYTGKQIKVTLNGSTISKTKTPGILVDGVAIVPYNDIFQNFNLGAECVYDKAKGTVTISKYGITIKMTIGSKKATVNGKAATLPVAPIKIKYMVAESVKILVPSRFVSETLGLGYSWNSSSNTVAITKKSILLSYNGGKKFEYTGAQGLVTINGKKVDLGTMSSIITNNTAMLRAKKVFVSSTIGAKYQYNGSNKTVTLTKGENVLVMTVGNTVAHLNGNPMVMDTAPMIVKNYDDGLSYVMVPGSFTASCLGYDYTWNNSKKTSMITSRTNNETSSSGSPTNNTDPELGDSGVVTETGTILNQWNSNDTLYAKCTELHDLSSAATYADGTGIIYSFSRDYSNTKANSETFLFQGTIPFDKVTATHTGNTITIQASDMTCTNQTNQMYGVSSNYVNTIGTINNVANKSSSIELEVLPERYSYDISLSSDRLSLYVTVYINSITSVTVGTNTAGDYITLNGLMPFNASVNKSEGYISIDLPNTINSLGDIYSDIFSARYIKQVNIINGANKTQIILIMNDGYEYYTTENGNQFTLLLQTPGQSQQTTPTGGSSGGSSGSTAGSNISNYEIVIPKPDGISASMLTDEDYYYHHYFVIKLPGNYIDYFSKNTITYTSSVIKNFSVTLNNNNETEITIATSKLQGYELTEDSKNIYVNIGNPKDIYKNIVVLDPGHGGAATGALYYGTNEKDVNFKILYTLRKKYFDQDTSKLKVYYTRIKDVDSELSERAAFASEYGADLFVSLHMNASYYSDASGTEVYYSDSNNSANSAGLTSKTLATIFANSLTSTLGTSNRGAKSAKYTVVHKNTVPAVLIELGFLSTKSDYAKLTNPTFQDNAAKTIYETLLQVFEAYPTGR